MFTSFTISHIYAESNTKYISESSKCPTQMHINITMPPV